MQWLWGLEVTLRSQRVCTFLDTTALSGAGRASPPWGPRASAGCRIRTVLVAWSPRLVWAQGSSWPRRDGNAALSARMGVGWEHQRQQQQTLALTGFGGQN